MKTTIEIKGYLITIDENSEQINVTASKDEETIEEFTLELNENEEEEVQDFGEFNNDTNNQEDAQEDAQEEVQEMPNEEEVKDEENESVKLKTFESFFNDKN